MSASRTQTTPNNDLLSADEIFDLLMNERSFFDKLYERAPSYIAALFTAINSNKHVEKIVFFYEGRRDHNDYFSHDVRNITRDSFYNLKCGTSPEFNALENASSLFVEYMVNEIKRGNITLPQATSAALALLYSTDKPNIAAASRETGMTRGALKNLMLEFPKDTYQRYCAVTVNKKPYQQVMGDCIPYLHNYPQFTPISLINEKMNAEQQIQAGDLVAEYGCSRWYTVTDLTVSGGCIFTQGGILHLPVRHISKEHRAAASRVCRHIDVQPYRS